MPAAVARYRAAALPRYSPQDGALYRGALTARWLSEARGQAAAVALRSGALQLRQKPRTAPALR